MLKYIYKKIPIPKPIRSYIARHIPEYLKRDKNLKNFGSVNDLYFWRSDNNITTIAPILNFYSPLFPKKDTNTYGQVWIWDNNNNLINNHKFDLPHMGIYELNINNYVKKNMIGTFMWVIKIPDSIAQSPSVKENRIYFTDRGYICFLKNNHQPCFMHGIDRFLIFQKQDISKFDFFYLHDDNKSWISEIPLSKGSEEKIEIILINRSKKSRKFRLNVYKNNNKKIITKEYVATSTSVIIFELTKNEINQLDNEFGYFIISGISTTWGRPAIMRHYKNGALSLMHC